MFDKKVLMFPYIETAVENGFSKRVLVTPEWASDSVLKQFDVEVYNITTVKPALIHDKTGLMTFPLFEGFVVVVKEYLYDVLRTGEILYAKGWVQKEPYAYERNGREETVCFTVLEKTLIAYFEIQDWGVAQKSLQECLQKLWEHFDSGAL